MQKENSNPQREIENLKKYISSDFDLKVLELYYKEILPKKSNTLLSSPILPIMLSAFFALIGTGFGAWLQGRSNLELEKQKYESSLVLKMVETNNKKDAISNLEFALRLGLINNEKLLKNIQQALDDSTIVNIAAYSAETDSAFRRRIQNMKNSNDDIDSFSAEKIKKEMIEKINKIDKVIK